MSPPSEYTLDDVLRWVNQTRQEHSLPAIVKLPKGEQADSRRCVIARAVNGRGYDTECIPNVQLDVSCPFTFRETVVYPPFVEQFVGDFDVDLWPELIGEAA